MSVSHHVRLKSVCLLPSRSSSHLAAPFHRPITTTPTQPHISPSPTQSQPDAAAPGQSQPNAAAPGLSEFRSVELGLGSQDETLSPGLTGFYLQKVPGRRRRSQLVAALCANACRPLFSPSRVSPVFAAQKNITSNYQSFSARIKMKNEIKRCSKDTTIINSNCLYS